MAEVSDRAGSHEDEQVLFALFDEAVAWMVARGQERQWGHEPPSREPGWRKRIEGLARNPGLRILQSDRRAVGALAVGDAPDYVSPAEVSELYVQLLLTARSDRGAGLGGELLAAVERIARGRDVTRLRVDCWADAPTLVGWYESQGFERSETFEVNDGWRGQVLVRPVPYEAGSDE